MRLELSWTMHNSTAYGYLQLCTNCKLQVNPSHARIHSHYTPDMPGCFDQKRREFMSKAGCLKTPWRTAMQLMALRAIQALRSVSFQLD